MAFLDLPLDLVAEALCLRCNPEERPICPNGMGICGFLHLYENPSIHLAQLCLTSKLLNSIVTRHLYHHPSTRRWWLLARTLIEHPDLIPHVKHLRCCGWNVNDDETIPAEVLGYYKQWRLTARTQATGGQESLTETALLDRLQTYNDHTEPMNLMVSLCTDLEQLVSHGPNGRLFTACTPGSLKNLQKVQLSHDDDELGISLEYIAPLALAAPRLNQIAGDSVASYSGSETAFGCLTRIRLVHSCIGEIHLTNLLKDCPLLEEFDYEAGGATVGDCQFTPREAQDAFVRYALHLKVLKLNMDGDTNSGQGELLHREWLLRSLVGLTKLQELHLDGRCIIPHMDPYSSRHIRGPNGNWVPLHQGGVPDPDIMALVRLLPPQIRSVRVVKEREGPDTVKLEKALDMLAETVTEFPELTNVSVSGLTFHCGDKELTAVAIPTLPG